MSISDKITFLKAWNHEIFELQQGVRINISVAGERKADVFIMHNAKNLYDISVYKRNLCVASAQNVEENELNYETSNAINASFRR